MAIQKGEKHIRGVFVAVSELPTRPKLKVMYRIGRVLPAIVKNLGGIIGSVSALAEESGIDVSELAGASVDDILSKDIDIVGFFQKLDYESLGNMIGGLFEALPEDEFFDLCELILQGTLVKGKNAGEMLAEGYTGEDVFGEDMPLLFEVLAFTIGVNRFLGKEGIGTLLGLKKLLPGENTTGSETK